MSAGDDGILAYSKIMLLLPEALILEVKDPQELRIDTSINKEVSWLNTESQAALGVVGVSSPVQQK